MTTRDDRRLPDPSGPFVPRGPSQAAPARTEGGSRLARGRRGLQGVLRELEGNPRWRECFVHWHRVEAREARLAGFPAGLDPRLVEAYARRGVESLYSHQEEAIQAALEGRDVLVATPTASGKTICYTAPVLHELLATDGKARALFLFPTKALSQDQTVGLTALVEELGVDWHAFTYDGDTPPAVRRTLRDRGHMILTNPYMLHQGILPNHAKWAELFRDLRYIVVDEVHTLSGVFGSSVANVLRRLLRIARHYGSNPRFLASSATLRDGADHAAELFGRPVQVVERDGSPAGPRTFGVYNPPIVNPVAGLRASALEEARELATVLCGPGHQAIFFCGRRTAVEVLTRYLKESAQRLGLRPDEIRGYRGGYLPLKRREIEAGLKDGSVKVVVSTNALELGIDIGALDVAVLVGYPGTQASFWQRAGRVGRRGEPSLVVQIARSEPVDQYLALHPVYLFEEPKERLGLDPDNLVLLSEQLKCGAFELPFQTDEDGDLVGEPEYARSPHLVEMLDYLADEAGFLLERSGTYYWMADAYPAQDVSLDGGEPDNVLVFELDPRHAQVPSLGSPDEHAPREAGQRAIGEVDRESAITTVHEGAIYQVEGETWRIERFDYKNRRAWARRVDSDYFTDAQTDTDVRVLRVERQRLRTFSAAPDFPSSAMVVTPEGELRPADERPLPAAGAEDYSALRGEVHVTTLATIYKKIRFYTRENVGAGDIHLPAEELDTEAFMLALSDESAMRLGLVGGDRGAAWRAVGNLLRRTAPLFVRCQASDLGISTQVRAPHFGRPTIFLWDRVQGGVGLADLLFEEHRSVLAAAREVVRRCDCGSGCPACVGPVAEVGPLGKETALAILDHLVGGGGPTEVEPEVEIEPEAEMEAGAELEREPGASA